MPCRPAPNCTYPASRDVAFAANPDIVTISFICSATLTFVLTTIAYLSENGAVPSDAYNDLDRLMLKGVNFVRRRINASWTLDAAWALDVIRKVILMVSDQQLITGVAIVSVGFYQHCTITYYHAYIVFLLGQISFAIHQSTVIVVSDALFPTMRAWRAAWITAFYVVNLINTVITSADGFLDVWGRPAQCTWNDLVISDNSLFLVMWLFLDTWGFISIVRVLYPAVNGFWDRLGKGLLGLFIIPTGRIFNATWQLWRWTQRAMRQNASQDWSRGPSWRHALLTTLYLAVGSGCIIVNFVTFLLFLVALTVSELWGSWLIDLWRVYVSILWLTYEVMVVKWSASSGTAMQGDEDEWGFGQVLPMLLLVLPLMAAMEIYYDARKGDDETSGHRRSSSVSPSTNTIAMELLHSDPNPDNTVVAEPTNTINANTTISSPELKAHISSWRILTLDPRRRTRTIDVIRRPGDFEEGAGTNVSRSMTPDRNTDGTSRPRLETESGEDQGGHSSETDMQADYDCDLEGAMRRSRLFHFWVLLCAVAFIGSTSFFAKKWVTLEAGESSS